jgi:hypothetical protein
MKHAIKHIHFVGLGGAGMSGIAEVLFNLGYRSRARTCPTAPRCAACAPWASRPAWATRSAH